MSPFWKLSLTDRWKTGHEPPLWFIDRLATRAHTELFKYFGPFLRCFGSGSKFFGFMSNTFGIDWEHGSFAWLLRSRSVRRFWTNVWITSALYSTYGYMRTSKMDHVWGLCKREFNKSYGVLLTWFWNNVRNGATPKTQPWSSNI